MLVVAVLVFGGGFLLLRTVVGGSGGATCDKQQVPLGVSDLSEKGFQTEDGSLAKVLSLLNTGDISGAESAFYQDSHTFTHDADAKIRQQNEQTAKDLCNAVLTLEDHFTTTQQTSVLVADLQRVRGLLSRGGQALGYSPLAGGS